MLTNSTLVISPLSHSWAHVVIGMWHKYPNPHCSHVVTVDVIDRSVDPLTGIIRTERVLGCKQKAPTWIIKVCFSLLSPRHFPYRRITHSFWAVRRMRLFVRSPL
jgi:PRELI-like family